MDAGLRRNFRSVLEVVRHQSVPAGGFIRAAVLTKQTQFPSFAGATRQYPCLDLNHMSAAGEPIAVPKGKRLKRRGIEGWKIGDRENKIGSRIW